MHLFFYTYKNLIITNFCLEDKNNREFIFYKLFSPKELYQTLSIEIKLEKLEFFNHLKKYYQRSIYINDFKIITNTKERLNIQYIYQGNSYKLNSYVPFYGKTTENKIFVNNISEKL